MSVLAKRTWAGIRDGFSAFGLAIHYRYNDYGCFWEELSIGWYGEYIFPYDDFHNAIISKERQLRLNQHPPDLSKYPWS
jgi:hypothetical protein